MDKFTYEAARKLASLPEWVTMTEEELEAMKDKSRQRYIANWAETIQWANDRSQKRWLDRLIVPYSNKLFHNLKENKQ